MAFVGVFGTAVYLSRLTATTSRRTARDDAVVSESSLRLLDEFLSESTPLSKNETMPDTVYTYPVSSSAFVNKVVAATSTKTVAGSELRHSLEISGRPQPVTVTDVLTEERTTLTSGSASATTSTAGMNWPKSALLTDSNVSQNAITHWDAFCQVPPGGFKAWNRGLVTVLEPVFPRDCQKLMAGDKAEARRVLAASKQWKNVLTDAMFLMQTGDCLYLKKMFSDIMYNSILEKGFPLAFIFVINDAPQQVFRLLKLLYRPQNLFCIHYDKKTSPQVRQVFDNIAKCFSNVMIASKLENVIWGYNTIMEAQMNCLHDLHKHRTKQPAFLKWRYVVNLCGKELPLVSNRELASHLSALNGSSSILTRKATDEEVTKRTRFKAVVNKQHSRAVTSGNSLGPPPFNITIYKGSSYNAFSYAFVDFILTDKKVKTIHNFFMYCKNPEEHFYASVYMMPNVPGGFNPRLSEAQLYVRVARAIWCFDGKECQFGFHCNGEVLRQVCITNSADLPAIMKSFEADRHMFHNKYFLEVDHTVMDCLEERIVAKNIEEYNQECKQK